MNTKIINSVFSISLIFCLSFLFSCKKDSVTPDDPTSSCVRVDVTTNIDSPTTWKNGNVYVISTYIKVKSELTIEPGVVIKLDGGRIEVTDGKITANGTAEKRIVFTSIADDSYCGDTNGDGNATTPQKGDWVCIYLNGGTNNTFTYCDFLYAGQNDGGANHTINISITGSSFQFNNCVFAHSLEGTSDLSYAFQAHSYMSDNTISIFENNAFYDNDKPIYLSAFYALSPTNIFHNPKNSNEGNKRNAVFVHNHFMEDAIANFSITEVPFVFTNGFYSGGDAAERTVNISDNVVLKFKEGDKIDRGPYNDVNIGSGVIFTSFKDDEHGGDSNGDGNTTVPANGDWEGFYDHNTLSYVNSANILYAAN